MQEFSSISVSAYEPDELTKQLNEQTAAGWSVVSIVPTGSTVTAYLSKDSGAAGAAAGSAASSTGDSSVGATSAADSSGSSGSSGSGSASDSAGYSGSSYSDSSSYGTSSDSSDSSAAAGSVVGAVYSSETIATDDGTTGRAEYTAVSDTGAAVSDQIGWSSSDTASGAAQAASDAGQQVGQTAGNVVSSEVGAAAAASSAAPPGWYADPAGRFELRYWDGGQWTDHVSRGGQQYTDPPVA